MRESVSTDAVQASSDGDSGGSAFGEEAEAASDDSDLSAPGEDALAGEQPRDGDGDSDEEGSVDFDPEIVEDPRCGVEVIICCHSTPA